jgi:signal transduction histidine kinase
VLDFARGRLGGGLVLDRRDKNELRSRIQHVIDEVRTAHPDRVIEDTCSVGVEVPCDVDRIEQLVSNLLANAVTHGSSTGPVRVEVSTLEQCFRISVSNSGEPIGPEVMKGLFKPFKRAAAQPRREGLGLGLYIAHEIAKAHSGTLDVESSESGTRFTFLMPL